jgi:hypothetical protein
VPRGEAGQGERRAEGRGVKWHPVNGSGLRMGCGSFLPEQAPQGVLWLIWIETCFGHVLKVQ